MTHRKLYLPALRANMGDWTYYIASMTLKELARRVTTASIVYESKTLDALIQRSVSSRAGDIADYLLSQPQRLMGTLVVGVHGGQPEWLEVEIRKGVRPWNDSDERLEGAIGLLRLSGAEKLFALCGQHRVVGIERALRDDASLGNEEAAVIFVRHSDGQAGLERTRRLFSTLNRYVKPVSKPEIIALDKEDAVAIVTRRLVDDHPLFADRVALGTTKALRTDDKSSFTSIVTLYACLEMVLKLHQEWRGRHKKKTRPTDDVLDHLTQHCKDYWALVVDEHEALQAYMRAPRDASPARPFRGRQGGHLLFRPVGLMVHTWAVTSLCINEGEDLKAAVRRVAEVPTELSKAPWLGLFWNGESRQMITSPEAQKVARWLVYYSSGGDLARLRTDETRMRTELAGLLSKSPGDVELPSLST